jgi:hypothetical protein
LPGRASRAHGTALDRTTREFTPSVRPIGSRDPIRVSPLAAAFATALADHRTRVEPVFRRAGPQDLRPCPKARPTSLRMHRRTEVQPARSLHPPVPENRSWSTPESRTSLSGRPRLVFPLPWWGGCSRSRQRSSTRRFPRRRGRLTARVRVPPADSRVLLHRRVRSHPRALPRENARSFHGFGPLRGSVVTGGRRLSPPTHPAWVRFVESEDSTAARARLSGAGVRCRHRQRASMGFSTSKSG